MNEAILPACPPTVSLSYTSLERMLSLAREISSDVAGSTFSFAISFWTASIAFSASLSSSIAPTTHSPGCLGVKAKE